MRQTLPPKYIHWRNLTKQNGQPKLPDASWFNKWRLLNLAIGAAGCVGRDPSIQCGRAEPVNGANFDAGDDASAGETLYFFVVNAK
jgi:hypothetical protein